MNIPLSSPYIGKEEIKAVTDVLKTPNLSMGPKIDEFEKKISEYIGTKYAVGVNSGTSGLHILIRALGIKDNDEVITTPFSFIASSNCMLYERAKPVFVDIDEKTLNIDPGLINEAITKKTKAILLVHAFGQPCDMKQIMEIAEDHNLKVIEDACEAIGSEYLGKKVGTFGDAAVFAFYPNKQITTGEGGMIVSNDEKIYKLARSLRNQGRSENMGWLDHKILGYNYRLDEMSAALGVVQLKKIEKIIEMRNNVAQEYNKRLKDVEGVEIPCVDEKTTKMSWFVYVIHINKKNIQRENRKIRDKIVHEITNKGIGSKPYFTPIHLQPFYREMGFREGDFPITELAGNTGLALPFFTDMKIEQIEYVCDNLKDLMDKI
ncbi:conserved hypothetical protein [groundwater metagenome]|uniref:Polysaccharide biosynthesis protein n=1 Tax=groundwater metagenome TaxID=717931 RepID=A0A098EBK2_9ZZZZ